MQFFIENRKYNDIMSKKWNILSILVKVVKLRCYFLQSVYIYDHFRLARRYLLVYVKTYKYGFIWIHTHKNIFVWKNHKNILVKNYTYNNILIYMNMKYVFILNSLYFKFIFYQYYSYTYYLFAERSSKQEELVARLLTCIFKSPSPLLTFISFSLINLNIIYPLKEIL